MQREIEDSLSEQILFGELVAGTIVVVDVEGEGDDATFTYKGEPMTEPPDLPDHPDLPPVESAGSAESIQE
jgi:ATP-dependent Clp protease ATP-binding subunit ClpC